jgi:hypothetical protein
VNQEGRRVVPSYRKGRSNPLVRLSVWLGCRVWLGFKSKQSVVSIDAVIVCIDRCAYIQPAADPVWTLILR